MRGLAICGVLLTAGCPTTSLGEEPADIGLCSPHGGTFYFQNVLWPKYIQDPATTCGPNHDLTCDCTSCHSGGRIGALDFSTNVPMDFTKDYEVATQWVSCTTPSASQLLTRPLQVDGHPVQMFTMSDPKVQLFLGWFD
jgi:hypothetical protein